MDRKETTEKVSVDIRTILEQLGLSIQKWEDNESPDQQEPQ